MNVYTIVAYELCKRPVKAMAVIAESRPEAVQKVKSTLFTPGIRGYNVTKMVIEDKKETGLTLLSCAKEIVKNSYIRIGKSILTYCYDGTVSVVDWTGKTTWFPKLTVEAVQKFIDIQPK